MQPCIPNQPDNDKPGAHLLTRSESGRPMKLSLSDQAVKAFSWAAGFVALFVSAAVVLCALFGKRDRQS